MSESTSTDKSEIREEPVEKVETKPNKTYVSILKANSFYSEVSKILHWRDPVKSGLLFGIFNFFFFLSTWGDYSLVTIISYLLLTTLLIALGYANYIVLSASWLQGKQVENPFIERFKNESFHISEESAKQHFTTLVDLANHTIDKLREVYFCTDNTLSLKFALFFYLGAVVGNWFSGATLLYLVTLGLFVWPKLYEEKKREIDQFYDIALVQGDKYYQLGLSKLPPAVTARFPQLKPKSS